ncbi:2-Hydroxyacid oxidase 2-like [Tubulanus polymorphus]|uniref:2-Hydroxyacid oxidase 2-like n=1 Tax=Tubulanus polymorphus TaxID=672921 RepID=UPI003DA5B890
MSGKSLVCLKDYEIEAKKILPRMTWEYYSTGADEEISLRENELAYKRLKLRPSFLRDVSNVDVSTKILGHSVDSPICIAPSAFHCLAHQDGEVATAKAAAKMNSIYTMSTFATRSMEEVNKEAPAGDRWLQCYILKPRSFIEKMLKRAVAENFKAVVLTVDWPAIPNHRASTRNPFSLPSHLKLRNIHDQQTDGQDIYSTNSGWSAAVDASLTWKDIAWLKEVTNLPVIVKGILTAEDAELAIEHGASAIIVSNHGGRQLDTSPATIEVLPEIVAAVRGRVEVYVDGGIRTGTDVLKALALGAKAVLIGRPVLWGLACNGEQGVENVLKMLKDELSTAMALSGCQRISDIKPKLVVKGDYYFSKL